MSRGYRVSRALLAALGLLTLIVLFTPCANALSRLLVVAESLGPSDVIVVLGGGVTRDGSLSEISLRRVWYGVRLFKHGYAPLLIFSTGVTSTGSNGVSEAGRMADAARDMGLPSSAILLEERSTRTAENATEIVKIIRARQYGSVLLVTHPTHMRRASAAFRRAGVVVRPAPTDGNEIYGSGPAGRGMLFFKVVYEYAAWTLYWWKGWV